VVPSCKSHSACRTGCPNVGAAIVAAAAAAENRGKLRRMDAQAAVMISSRQSCRYASPEVLFLH
jgi:hypothetical protein